MTTLRRKWAAIVFVFIVCPGIVACSDRSDASTEREGESVAVPEGVREHASAPGVGEHAGTGSTEDRGEHGDSREGAEHGAEREKEESRRYIGLADTWDTTGNGVRLVLSFDPTSATFVGTVENTTAQRLCAVRVEVHLSDGSELGPTDRMDLLTGEKVLVELPTEGKVFDRWTAHSERSPCATVSAGRRAAVV